MRNHNSLSHEMQASVTWRIKVRFVDIITGSKLLSHGSKDVFLMLLRRVSRTQTHLNYMTGLETKAAFLWGDLDLDQ